MLSSKTRAPLPLEAWSRFPFYLYFNNFSSKIPAILFDMLSESDRDRGKNIRLGGEFKFIAAPHCPPIRSTRAKSESEATLEITLDAR